MTRVIAAANQRGGVVAFADGPAGGMSTREWRAALRTATDLGDKVLEAPSLTAPPPFALLGGLSWSR